MRVYIHGPSKRPDGFESVTIVELEVQLERLKCDSIALNV